MKGADKTSERLISEVERLRQRVTVAEAKTKLLKEELRKSEDRHQREIYPG